MKGMKLMKLNLGAPVIGPALLFTAIKIPALTGILV